MRISRLVALVVIWLAASSCTGQPGSDPNATVADVRDDNQPNETSNAPTTPAAPASTATIDLLAIATPSGSLLDRWRDLSAHGYSIGPAASTEQGWSDLASRHTGIQVAEFRLNWGVDSGAHLVVVEGTAEAVASAQAEIEPMADRVIGGDEWAVGLSRRIHAEIWELDDLADLIGAIREPVTACDNAPDVCPLGPASGPSPPPPRLILEGPRIELDLPVEVHFLGHDASGLRGSGGASASTWVDGGQAVLTFTLNDRQVRGSHVIASTSFGGTVVTIDGPVPGVDVDGGRIALYEPNGKVHGLGRIPAAWVLDGLALTVRDLPTGSQYEVIAVGRDEGDRPLAVTVDASDAIRGIPLVSTPVIDTVPLLDLGLDDRWTLPQWTPAGLTVVAERADGWYLVDDVFGQRVDLLRSSHPIVGYAADQLARHVVLAVAAPDGITNYWVSDDQIVRLESTSASMAWLGSHRQ